MFKSHKKDAEIKVHFLEEMLLFVSEMKLEKCRHINLGCFLNKPGYYESNCYIWGLGLAARDGIGALRDLFWNKIKFDSTHKHMIKSYDEDDLLFITRFQLAYDLGEQHFCIRVDLRPNRFLITFQEWELHSQIEKPWLQYEFAKLTNFSPELLDQLHFNWRKPKQIAEFFRR